MKKAFTLLELLISIFIISILAAILFPVFNRIKIQSNNSVSISNIKQLGYAWKMYCEDYDDYMMRYVTNNYTHWFGDSKTSLLNNYIDLKKIKDPYANTVEAPSYWIGYGYNGLYFAPMDNYFNHIPVNYNNISNPSNTVVFSPVAGLFIVNDKEGLYPMSLIYPPQYGFPTFHARYNGKSPVLWADLHVSNKIPKYFYLNNKYKKYNLGFLDSDNNISTDELFDLE